MQAPIEAVRRIQRHVYERRRAELEDELERGTPTRDTNEKLPEFDVLLALLKERKAKAWFVVQSAHDALARAKDDAYPQERFDAALAWYDAEQHELASEINMLEVSSDDSKPTPWKPKAVPKSAFPTLARAWREIDRRFRNWYCSDDYERALQLLKTIDERRAELGDMMYQTEDYRRRIALLTKTEDLDRQMRAFASATRAPIGAKLPAKIAAELEPYVPDIGRMYFALAGVAGLCTGFVGAASRAWSSWYTRGYGALRELLRRDPVWATARRLGIKWNDRPPPDSSLVGELEGPNCRELVKTNIVHLERMNSAYSQAFAALRLQDDAAAMPHMATVQAEFEAVTSLMVTAISLNLMYAANAEATERAIGARDGYDSPGDLRAAIMEGIANAPNAKTSAVCVAYRAAVAARMTAELGNETSERFAACVEAVHGDAVATIGDAGCLENIRALAERARSHTGGGLFEKAGLWAPLPEDIVPPVLKDFLGPGYAGQHVHYRVLDFENATSFKDMTMALAAKLSGMFAVLHMRLCDQGNSMTVGSIPVPLPDYTGPMTMRLLLVEPLTTVIHDRARTLAALDRDLEGARAARDDVKRRLIAAGNRADKEMLQVVRRLPAAARRFREEALRPATDGKAGETILAWVALNLASDHVTSEGDKKFLAAIVNRLYADKVEDGSLLTDAVSTLVAYFTTQRQP